MEVSGRYSNHADQETRIREVLQFELYGSPKHKTQTPRQVQRRLSANELETLLRSYESGTPVNVLADEFHIHRSTVLDHLSRSTARRRYPALDERGTQLAIQLYNSGLSLREVGISLNVHASTVRETLKKSGIARRARSGWPTQANESRTSRNPTHSSRQPHPWPN